MQVFRNILGCLLVQPWGGWGVLHSPSGIFIFFSLFWEVAAPNFAVLSFWTSTFQLWLRGEEMGLLPSEQHSKNWELGVSWARWFLLKFCLKSHLCKELMAALGFHHGTGKCFFAPPFLLAAGAGWLWILGRQVSDGKALQRPKAVKKNRDYGEKPRKKFNLKTQKNP